MRYPDPAAADRHHGTLLHVVVVMRDEIRHQGNALLRRNIWQAHDTGVRTVVQIDQLTEVGVDRDQDPASRFCQMEQSQVPGIGAERASLDDIVPVGAKRLCKMAPGASIDQEPNYSPTATGASVSRAMTACA